MLLGFVVRAVFVASLGLELVGVDAALVAVLAVLSLADAGLEAAVMYSLYKPIATQDTVRVNAILHYAKRLFRFVALVILVLGAIAASLIDKWVDTDAVSSQELRIYLLIMVGGAAVKYLLIHRSIMLVADQRMYVVRTIHFIVQFVRQCVQIYVLIFLGSYLAFVIAFAVGMACNAIVVHWVSGRRYAFLKEPAEPLEGAGRKTLRRNMGAMFAYRASNVVLTNTAPLLIVGVVSATAGGSYSNYMLIIASGLVLLDMAFSALLASVGSLVAGSSQRKARKVFDQINLISSCLFGTLSVFFFFAITDIVTVWVGSESRLQDAAVALIIVNFLLYGQTAPVAAFRQTTRLFYEVRWILPFTALIGVLLTWGLGVQFGLVGALAGVPLARAMMSNWLEPFILVRWYLDGDIGSYVLQLVRYYAPVVFVIGILYYADPFNFETSLLNALAQAALGVLAITALYWLVWNRTEAAAGLLGRLRLLKAGS